MEDLSEQYLLQKFQEMEETIDKLEREYQPCKCHRNSRIEDPKSVDIQDVGLIDLSGTSQHLKELHSVREPRSLSFSYLHIHENTAWEKCACNFDRMDHG